MKTEKIEMYLDELRKDGIVLQWSRGESMLFNTSFYNVTTENKKSTFYASYIRRLRDIDEILGILKKRGGLL